MIHIINNTMQIVNAKLLTHEVVVDIFPSQAFSWPISAFEELSYFSIILTCHGVTKTVQYVYGIIVMC